MQYTEGYLLANRYLLNRFVGGGSFGEVWVAHDEAADLEVAVKIYIAMDEKGLEEFRKEFQLSFELNHTNLLHANYLGLNDEDNRPFLVMPYCPDGSVSKYAGNMKEEDLWRFVHDVAAGLAYLHAQNPPIIHQDIKPDHILILKNGDYVITDFGISKQLRQSLRKSALQLNSAGAISYMGPERFSKQFQAVKASDIWSLGAALFELASGDVPFCGMGGSLQKQGADMPDIPEEYSARLNMVCSSCMAKETWDRPTAAQLRDYAGQVLDGRKAEITWNYDGPYKEPAPLVKATVMVSDLPAEPEEPVKEEPVQEAPVEEVPVVETPVEAEPVKEAPVEETPAETAPAEDAPAAEAPAPEETIGVQIPASTPADNIDAPDQSGFVKEEAPATAHKLSFALLAILAVVGLALGAGIGYLIF